MQEYESPAGIQDLLMSIPNSFSTKELYNGPTKDKAGNAIKSSNYVFKGIVLH